MDENGERKCATISDHVHTLHHAQTSREYQLRFILKVDGEQLDISYNQLREYSEDTLDTGQTEDGLHKFKSIQDYKGPYSPSNPEYLGSSYNLLIEWEPGEITWEPLTNIMADDPYSWAVHAKKLTYVTHKDGSI